MKDETAYINILIADEALARIDAVADDLRNSGMVVEHVGRITGIVSGSVDASHVDRLRGVDGVRRLAFDRAVELPAAPRDDALRASAALRHSASYRSG
jgi:hypothetical protein